MRTIDEKSTEGNHVRDLGGSHLEDIGTPVGDEVDASATDLEKKGNVKDDESEGSVQWSGRQILATLSLCCVYVGSQLPLYFTTGSLSFIVKSVGGLSISSWLATSYALAFASLAPFSGYLQDVFGRRYISLIGAATLCVGLVLIGTSHTMTQAIVGMTISGIGAAIGELTALAGTSEIVPVKKRGLYLGLVTGCVLPFSPYAIYTTLLGTHSTWRWGIWIALMCNGVALVGIGIFYFPRSQVRGEGQLAREILAKIDFIGGILSTAGLTLFLVGVSAGGYTSPWANAKVLCPLIIGILLVVAFVFWEWRGAAFPMIPSELFKGHRIVGMSFLVAFVAGMYFYAILNFVPVMYLDIYKPDPIQAGVKGVIIAIGVTAGAVFPNILLSVWKNHNRWILFACALLSVAFSAALVTCTPADPVQTIALGTVAGFGIGGVVAAAVTTAVIGSPDNLIATCVALSPSIRTVGGSVGTAIFSNIFKTKLKHKLPVYVASYAIAAGLPLSSAEKFVKNFLEAPQSLAAAEVPGLTEAVVHGATIGSRWAYAESLKYVWYTSLPFGILACVACLLIGNSTSLMTNRIAADISREIGWDKNMRSGRLTE